MKKQFSRLVCLLLLLSVLPLPVRAAGTLRGFRDVPASHWANSAIAEMVEMGLFAGTTAPDENGMGTFAPDNTLTRGEFITVITKYLFPDEIKVKSREMASDAPWYATYHAVALDMGLLKKYDLRGLDGMAAPMNRQEAAFVLERACLALGEEEPRFLIPKNIIPDNAYIGSAYWQSVRICYTKGLIAGTDSRLTFSPMSTLTRAQAAMVLYKLINKDARTPIDANSDDLNPLPYYNTSRDQTPVGGVWKEGEYHTISDLQVGAVVIKADGTKVTLKRDLGNVLGAGQGVDIFTGLVDVYGYPVKMGGHIEGYSSCIYGRDTTVLKKSSITGEVHTETEWHSIMSATNPTGEYRGDYDGERFRNYWVWDARANIWYWSLG